MEILQKIVDNIYNLVWSDVLVYLCLLTGTYFTIRFRLPQLRYLNEMIRLLFSGKASSKGISSFQAFSLAISGRVGTGNIAGVATAIGMGGPGAIFWMWVIAFVGSASAIVEAALGQLYKQEINGEYRGGPAYYIRYGLKNKAFAIIFAVVTIVSTGFLLPSVQSNSIAVAMDTAFGSSGFVTAGILIILMGLIIVGGVKRIGKVSELVVPFMAGIYILMALVIIGINYQEIPSVFSLIFRSAFGLDATFGGIVGAAISWGVKRGIYSNEAGQGTAPHAAAAAEVDHPFKQGLVQGFSVYVDTLFVCTATALMILFTGQYNVQGADGNFIIENLKGIEMGPTFTQMAVSRHFPILGSSFVAIALAFFAFTTIMAYYYIAETNVNFLFQEQKNSLYIWGLRFLLLVSIFQGCITTASTAWQLGDIGVGLMAWLNMLAILLLHKKVVLLEQDYAMQKSVGQNPRFYNKTYNIPNVPSWESKK